LIHYDLETADIDDRGAGDALNLLRDAQDVRSSVLQGMVPVGDWLQAPIAPSEDASNAAMHAQR
jgi:hypothetical protein